MNKTVFLFISVIFFLLPIPLYASPEAPVKISLGNGFEAILIENRSNPVISSVVTVKAGSSNESVEVSGISHMLEHLLFNGTKNRTQEQLYKETDFYGIYNNAHTGKDFTNYIIMSEKDNFKKAMEIQADMLFNSTFPVEKFEKEKGIIVNEMAKDLTNPSFKIDEAFSRTFFAGTPYNLPVIGITEKIMNMKRTTVADYYNTYYVPNNMTAIIMGDFDVYEMFKLLDKYFGQHAPGKIPEIDETSLNLDIENKRNTVGMDVHNNTLIFAKPLPAIGNKDFHSLAMAVMIFDDGLGQRLNERLKEKGLKEGVNAWAAFDFTKEFSFLKVNVTFPFELDPAVVESVFKEEVKDFVSRSFDPETINGILVSERVQGIALYEKPHYYGMMKGKFIAAGGWDFTHKFQKNIEASIPNLPEVASRYLKDASFMTFLVTHKDETVNKLPDYYNKPEKDKIFSSESLKLVEKWEKGESGVDSSSEKKKGKKVVFDNGLTLIVDSNPYSEVFATHILAKNRSAMEPNDKTGIADFLHRLLKKGTASMNEGKLSQRLSSIGASLKTHDSAFIPYDDYYTTNDFSYIRFETIDEFSKDGIQLLSEIIAKPRFLEKEIEQVRKELINIIRKDKKSANVRSKRMFLNAIFGSLPQAKAIIGTEETVNSITKKDLELFHSRYFSPNNLIVTVATSRPMEEVAAEFKDGMGEMKPVDVSFSPQDYSASVTTEAQKLKNVTGGSQSYVRVGRLFPFDEKDKGSLSLLGSLLSSQMSFDLREKKGVAYSLGAWFSFYDKYALFQISIGTMPDTLDKAVEGAMEWAKKASSLKIKKDDIAQTVNRQVFSKIMRSMTRISQCFYQGMEEFYKRPSTDKNKHNKDLKDLTPARITEVAEKYMKNGDFVQVVVE